MSTLGKEKGEGELNNARIIFNDSKSRENLEKKYKELRNKCNIIIKFTCGWNPFSSAI